MKKYLLFPAMIAISLASYGQSVVNTDKQGSVAVRVIKNEDGSARIVMAGNKLMQKGEPVLVVIDGVVATYQNISPDKIVTAVLLDKDAATALYGAAADKGALVITAIKEKE